MTSLNGPLWPLWKLKYLNITIYIFLIFWVSISFPCNILHPSLQTIPPVLFLWKYQGWKNQYIECWEYSSSCCCCCCCSSSPPSQIPPPLLAGGEHLILAFLTAPECWVTCHLPPANCHLPTATCQRPPANCHLPPANGHLQSAREKTSARIFFSRIFFLPDLFFCLQFLSPEKTQYWARKAPPLQPKARKKPAVGRQFF